MDKLDIIYNEQKKYDKRVKNEFKIKYETNYEQILAKTRCIIHEAVELERELKPEWAWWTDKKNASINFINSDTLRKMRIEAIDIFKFLLSLLIDLGIDSSEELYKWYMIKHEEINKRRDLLERES